MFCGKCGQQIGDGVLYCPYCGNRCAEPQAPAEPVQAPQQAWQEAPQQAWQEAPQQNWQEAPQQAWQEAPQQNWQEAPQQAWQEAPKQAWQEAPQQAWQEAPQQAWQEAPQQNWQQAPQQPWQEYPQQAWQPEPVYPNAAYAQPAPVRAEKQPKEKAVYPKSSAGLRIGSIVLCVFIFLFGFCAILQGSVRGTLSRSSMEKTIDNIDVTTINMRNDAGNAVPLMNYLEDVGGFSFRNDYEIDVADAERLANDPVCKDALKDWVLRYTDFYLNGTVLHPLTAEEVSGYLRDNAWRIKEVSGYNILGGSERYYDYNLQTYVQKSTADNTHMADDFFKDNEATRGQGIDKESIDNMVGFDTKLISIGLSVLALIGLSAITLLMLVLLCLINKKRMHSFFTYFGVTAIVLGGFAALLGGGGMIALSILKLGLIQVFANPLLIRLLIIGGAVLLLGLLVMLVGRSACDSNWRKRKAYDEWMKNNSQPQPEPVA